MNKSILKKSTHQFKQAFPGLLGIDIMASVYPIEPILVFTEYHMNRPVFGPHPHAGVSVMTYMLPDSEQGFINRDSLGDFSYIEPGGLHISQAGSGMFHDEFPKVTGVDTHGFQIWINHTSANRWVAPLSMHASSADIREVQTSDYKVRIIHGAFGDQFAPYKMVTDVDLFHIYLNPNASIDLDAKEMAFVYGLSGTGTVDTTEFKEKNLLNFGLEGDKVQVHAEEDALEFMFASARPLNKPIVYGGPFVMTTPEQMKQTQQRLASGEIGHLAPYISR